MFIDKRDLVNLMRHAYLLGTNEGIRFFRNKGVFLTVNDATNIDEKERDDYINSLIKEYERDDYMDYGEDQGSYEE